MNVQTIERVISRTVENRGYMPGRLAQQRMTFSDLEWPFHGSSVSSVCEGCSLKELNANVNALYTSSTLKSTSSASRAISAVAELLVSLCHGSLIVNNS